MEARGADEADERHRPHRPLASGFIKLERREASPEIVEWEPRRRERGRLTEDGQVGASAEHTSTAVPHLAVIVSLVLGQGPADGQGGRVPRVGARESLRDP